MSNFAGASKTVVIRTSRDTLGLVVAASAMTFAMAYAVHSKHPRSVPQPTPEARLQVPQQEWAGHLAELAPTTAATPAEQLSSAALVVPKSQLALPSAPARLPVRRPCLDAACVAKTAAATAQAQRRSTAAAAERATERDRSTRTLLGALNPLNHLPDMSIVGRPFTYAGNTVAGWFKRL